MTNVPCKFVENRLSVLCEISGSSFAGFSVFKKNKGHLLITNNQPFKFEETRLKRSPDFLLFIVNLTLTLDLGNQKRITIILRPSQFAEIKLKHSLDIDWKLSVN